MSFCATQAPDGTLLFGGNTLMSFDGDRWNQTLIPNSYALRSLDFGHDGRLWVAAYGEIGWFERTTDQRWKYRSLLPFLPSSEISVGEVWRVFAESDGATFVSTNRILRWTGNEFKIWQMPESRRLHAMRMDGTIYVHYLLDGLYRMGSAGPEIYIPRSVLKDAMVIWMETRANGVLLATSRGLFIYRDHTLHPFASEVSETLQRDLLTAAVRLGDGRYAFGTFTNGIVCMHPDGTFDRVLTEAEGLPTRAITSLFVDRDDSLWAMSRSHIFRIETNAPSSIFDERANLPPLSYHRILRSNGKLVLASENGLYELSAGARTFSLSESVREFVHDIHPAADALIVGMRRGAKRLSGSDASFIHTTNSDVLAIESSRRTPGTSYLSDNRRIVATSTNAASRLIVNDLPDIARSIAEDDAGNLWLGTIGRGVFFARIDPSEAVTAVPVPSSFGLPALSGASFVRAGADGSIFVFADNGGWMKPVGEQQFHPIENYPARAVAAVSVISPEGTVWLVHPPSPTLAASVARVTIGERRARWEPHSVPGLPQIGLPRSIFAENGSDGTPIVWIGGTKSVLRNVVRDGLVAPRPRPPLLRALVRAGDDALPLPVSAPLPYDTALIQFEIAAPEFSRRNALRLETRIDGIDRDWVSTGPDSRRDLTGLREGRYTFHARAVAETGVQSEATSLGFEVLPPFWRTPLFIGAAALMLVPLGYASYLLRVRNLSRRNAQLEAKVRERTEELERANAAKTQFVANMSHDIRNPLNGIVGLSLALEDTRLDRRQHELVATLRECTTYLSSLVDDVLDFASIEAGRIELRPRAFGPQELLRSIVETLKGEATASGAVIVAETRGDVPPTLLGDAGRIQQILVNFVSNALKYAGGTIWLSVEASADSPGEIEFAVRDEGPGLSAEEQTKLFTKFSRLRQVRGGEEIPGTGLGLAACRLLADIMSGSVGVESKPGEGARFFLRLPLAVAPEAASMSSAPLPNAAVLLVEDTDYNAWAATAVLGKLGLSCERARTGAEALQLFGERRFNVVLLDRNLPDMDGTEVARRMREMESDDRRAVLLAVTAYCTAGDRALCLEAGMDAFVGKPLTPEKLRLVLADAGRQLITAAPAQVSPETPPAEIDVSLLTFLSDGSTEGLDLQIRRFVSTLRETEAGMIAASTKNDFVTLAAGAHQLQGQARMVGNEALAQRAAQLEAAAQSHDRSACRLQLQHVRDQIGSLTEAMHRPRPAVPSA